MGARVYEVNEDDLANEMLAQASGDFVWLATGEIDADEFESVYEWFLA